MKAFFEKVFARGGFLEVCCSFFHAFLEKVFGICYFGRFVVCCFQGILGGLP